MHARRIERSGGHIARNYLPGGQHVERKVRRNRGVRVEDEMAADSQRRWCDRRAAWSDGAEARRDFPPAGARLAALESAGSWICLLGCESTQLDAAAMFEDACHHAIRQLQGAPAGSPVDDGRGSVAHRVQEGAQLAFERLLRANRKLLEIRTGAAVPAGARECAARLSGRNRPRCIRAAEKSASCARVPPRRGWPSRWRPHPTRNSSRAWAMSTLSVTTGMPSERTSAAGS